MSNQKDEIGARPDLREAIGRAAIQLLERRGVAGMSMSALAEEAGVSRQTLYNHFANVEDVLVAYLVDEMGRAERAMAAKLAGIRSPVARLRTFVEESVRRSSQRDIQLTMETMMSPEGKQRVLDSLSGLRALMQRIVDDGIESGEFRADLDPELTSAVLFSMVAVMTAVVHRGRHPGAVADHCFRLLEAALAAPPSASGAEKPSETRGSPRQNG